MGVRCELTVMRAVALVTRGALLAFALAACGDDDDGGADAAVDAPLDSVVNACGPSALCESGPMCGAMCCDFGEQCVDNECRCGSEPACAEGDYCTDGGPVAKPVDYCGLFCCGPVSGVGCPI
jgi:hypothetical protein